GDHRAGLRDFVGLGCAACHFMPDRSRAEQRDLGQVPLTGLGDRLPAAELAAFLADPQGRYPDGRMPKLPLDAATARNIQAFLLLWSKPSAVAAVEAPRPDELRDAVKRVGAEDPARAAVALMKQKGCGACHAGVDQVTPGHPVASAPGSRGCLSAKTLPR